MTKVVVVGGTRVAREAVAEALGRFDEIRVIGTFAPSGAFAQVAELAADVALVDALAPSALGIVRELVRVAPGVRVVALGVPEVEAEIIASAEAGVAAFVPSEASLEDLVATVGGAMRDEVVFSPRIAAALLRRVATLAAKHAPPSPDERFTMREREIAELLELGLSNKEIAARLSIALPTVKNHVHSILDKLEVNSRAEAAARLRRLVASTDVVPRD